jgi:hypothetical protein
MKTTKSLILALVAGLLFSPAAFARKKPVDLSDFAGIYQGTVTLTQQGESLNGTANVTIQVPKKGTSATILYTTQIAGTPFPTTVSLAGNKTASVSDAGVGLAGVNNTHPGSGTFSVHKGKLTFFVTNSNSSLTCTAKVRDVGKKRKLQLNFVFQQIDPYFFSTTLTAKAPKGK